ncbi:FAD-binding oxidoreductase [Bradyrhizobium liaoningense]|uniref:NAD(P)/FAD-dependent oxidoreductase n=1 Tax=Bradyrhizobium liaoningense TaxID=43992 RepID=UPI001BA57C50|nr:FAD-dependent oxidoreductase [Bradyrhizobium liaoningense]MBR0838842.1 FAD-binding oxidoreductase [Bradyrhizobium liaoningense]
MNTKYDVIVAGGGVIARATALELSARRLSVALIAPNSGLEKSASHAAGAMLGSFAEFCKDKWTLADQEEAKLRIESGRIWERWYRSIAERASGDGSVRRGTFIVATNHGSQDVENIRFIKAQADAWDEPSEWVEPKDVEGLAPHKLSRPQLVLSLPREGYIESRVLLDTLGKAISLDRSITALDETVVSIEADAHRVLVRTDRGTLLQAKEIVVAAGVSTLRLLPWLDVGAGHRLVMLGGRGSSAIVETPLAFAGVMRTPNRDFACGSHLVPLTGGRVYLGATNRLETTEFSNPKPTVGELHALCHSLANELNVHLRLGSVRETRAGFRPITSDGCPLFGRTSHDRVLVATGTYRNGILMAPAIARSIADEVTSSSGAAANPFSPANRAQLRQDRDPVKELLASVAQMVSFMQEPDGNLPFDRAAELEGLIRSLLRGVVKEADRTAVKETIEQTLARYPIQEAMPLILYGINSR